jgi:6-phosphogluconolactonase (cycloisomerase 2 family)
LGLDEGTDTEIAVMEFDPTTGTLTNAASPAVEHPTSSFGGCSEMVKIHKATRRLFVSNLTTINVFDIHPITGALTAVSGSPFLTDAGAENFGIAVNQAGTRIFVATWTSGVAVLDVASDGTATSVTGSPFAGPGDEDVPVLDDDETHLYVNTESSAYLAYSIAADGALTPLANSPYTELTTGYSAAFRRGYDQFLISDGGSELYLFNTDDVTGEPTAAPGNPFDSGIVGASFNGHSFSTDGSRLYTGTDDATVAAFDVAEDGTFTAVAGNPFDVGLSGSSCTAVSEDGAFVVVSDDSDNLVAVLRVDGTGIATAVTGSPFAVTGPTSTGVSGLALSF